MDCHSTAGIFGELRGLVKLGPVRYFTGMAPLWKKMKWLAILAGGPAVGYLVLVLLTPVFGQIVGAGDQQPPLRVIHLPGGWAPENAAAIRRLAKLHFDNQPPLQQYYWPDPTLIEERTNCWVVGFSTKALVYQFLGYRQVVRPSDQMMFFTIDKADFRTRFGIWY